MPTSLAERLLVGVAVHSRHGASLAASRVRPADIADATLRALYGAAIDCDQTTRDARVADVAERCDAPHAGVERLVADTPCMFDTSGSLAQAVLAEATQRRAADSLTDEVRALATRLRAIDAERAEVLEHVAASLRSEPWWVT